MKRNRETVSRQLTPKEHFFLMVRAGWQNKFRIMLVALCVCIVYCVYSYDQNQQVGRMQLVLNYKEAAKLLYPNGTQFNSDGIRTDEVLEHAIELGGLQGRTNAAELASHITVVPARSAPVTNQDNYYMSISYIITYYQLEELADIPVDSMLRLIGRAYKDVFYEKYSGKQTVLMVEMTDAEREMDYEVVGDVFNIWASNISRYLNWRENASPTFRASNNETFASLRSKVSDLINTDLSKYSAFVRKSGVSKDKESLIGQIAYNNKLLTRQYNSESDTYTIRLDTINVYDASITGAVLIPTYDLKGEFYMSRTKVGVDYMAEKAEASSGSMTGVLGNIERNNLKISDLRAGMNSPSDQAFALTMRDNLYAKLRELAATARKMDNEYIRETTKNYLLLSVAGKGLSELVNLKNAVVLFVGVAGLQVLLYAWFLMRKEAKK